MRLLYVCNDFGIPPNGCKGAAVHLRSITGALAALQHEVLLLSPGEAPGADHPARQVLPEGCPPVDKTVRRLKRWLSQRELDTAAAKELRPLIYNDWALARALDALSGRPPDAIIERLALMSHIGLDLAESLDVPWIVEVNALLTEEAGLYRSIHAKKLAGQIEQRVLHRADALIVVSKALAERIAGLGVRRERIHVIPNGADPSLFRAAAGRDKCRAILGISNELVIGFAGSLKVWHGVDVLFEAFARLQRELTWVRLLIVGTGPMEAALREAAHRSGLGGKVIFTGAVPHERMPEHLAAMDVAVAPFRQMEGFYFSPIKLFEYMAAGVCVVASRLGQIGEVVEDEVNGLLCSPDDVDDLTGALRRACDSPELRARLARTARGIVQRKFTWQHTARALLRVVDAAIQRRGNEAMSRRPRLNDIDLAEVKR